LHRRGSIVEDGEAVQAIAAEFINRVPEACRSAREARDGSRFHVTIVFSPRSPLPDFPPDEEASVVYPLGLCRKGTIYYVPVIIPAGERLNPNAHFHITLGFAERDQHDITKDLTGLLELHPGALEVLGREFIPMTARTAAMCAHLVSLGQSTPLTLLRLSLWHGRRGEIDKCLQYAPALSELDPLAGYYVRLRVDTLLRRGLEPLVHEMAAAASSSGGLPARTVLSDKQQRTLWDGVNSSYEMRFMHDEAGSSRAHKLPMNFSGVFKSPADPCHRVFASGAPSAKYARVLADMGVKLVVTLTEDRNELTTLHVPTPDREPPTLDATLSAILAIESASV